MKRRRKRPSPDRRRTGSDPVAHPADGARVGRRVGSRVLLVIGSTIVALVAAEILVRVLDLGPRVSAVYHETYQLSENPVLRYELRPGSRLGPVTINAAGMRDRDYPVEKPPRTFRIASIGDSIGFGYGTHQGGAYPGRLEDFLNRSFSDQGWRFEVLNFCVTGYNTPQAVEILPARALAYDPDLVLYGYCLNDPQDYSFELESLRAKLSPAEDGYLDRIARRGQRLALRSRLYALAVYTVQSLAGAPGPSHRVRPEPDWAALQTGTYPRYFRQLHQDDGGFARVRAGFATLAHVGREREIPVYVALFPLFRDLSIHPLEDVHAKVAAAAEGERLRVVDLAPLFRYLDSNQPGSFQFDDLHPNALGHAYAALAILQAMLEHGDLPVADRDLQRLAAAEGAEARWAQQVMAVAKRLSR